MCPLLRVILAIQPLHDIKIPRPIHFDWVAVEQIRHERQVAVGGELVGDKIGVDEAVADDVRDTIIISFERCKMQDSSEENTVDAGERGG